MKRKPYSRILTATEAVEGLVRRKKVSCFSEDSLRMAMGTFERLQESGVVVEGTFASAVWILSNETAVCRFRFPDDEDEYLAGAGTYTGTSFPEYVQAMKTFLLLHAGSESLLGLQGQLHELNLLTRDPDPAAGTFEPTYTAVQFLGFLSGEYRTRNDVCSELEEQIVWKKRDYSKRTLAEFSSYLRFDRQLEAFWNSSAPHEKLQWFFIWLWWNLTCILPLRPTEFLVTPWDCIELRDGQYFLTVRRTRLKKRKGTIRYRVETDYRRHSYEVPGFLAKAVLWYRSAVLAAEEAEASGSTPLYPPFPSQDSAASPGMEETSKAQRSYLFGGSRPLPYQDARLLLQAFLGDVLCWDNETELHLGDTRHLALISLIISGGSPIICRELADHESIEISSHYYTNTSRIIESASYFFTRNRGKNCFLASAPFKLPQPGSALHPVPGGSCDAPEVLAGDISECMKNAMPGAHCGDCIGCTHYYPDKDHLHRVVRQCRDQVDSDSAFLITILDQARKGLGMQDTIEAAFAKVQASSRRYFSVMTKGGTEYERKEVNHGTET